MEIVIASAIFVYLKKKFLRFAHIFQIIISLGSTIYVFF